MREYWYHAGWTTGDYMVEMTGRGGTIRNPQVAARNLRNLRLS